MAASLMFMGLDTSSRSLPQALDPEFFPSHNPVLRRRQTLEEEEQPRLITDLRNHPRPRQNRWELCSQVLSRQDVVAKLSQPW
jgi:hypothetical protein